MAIRYAGTLGELASNISREARDNRGRTVSGVKPDTLNTEFKWCYNLRSFIPEHVRPSVAGCDDAWRESDSNDPTSSRAKSGGTANAIKAARDFCESVIFQTGEPPIRIGLITPEGQNLSMPADQQLMIEEKIEKFALGRLAKCHAVEHFLQGWQDSSSYGPRYFHKYLIADPSTKSGMRAAIESVNPWECFEDMENRGDLADGDYFMRRQRQAAWRVLQRAMETNEGSKKRFAQNPAQHGIFEPQTGNIIGGHEIIDIDALKAAFVRGQSMQSGQVGINNTANQTGTPETDDLLWNNRGEVVDELWAFVPRSLVLDYMQQHTDALQWIPENAKPVIENGVHRGWSIPKQENEIGLEANAIEERVWVRLFLVNDALVGVLTDPGPLPYRRSKWHTMSGCRDALGIPDLNSTNQTVQDGLVRALDDDLKVQRTVFVGKQGMLQERPEDLLRKKIPFWNVDLAMGERMSDAIQHFDIPSNAEKFIRGLEFFSSREDLDTSMARVQQGGRSEGENTAYELSQRLNSGGRHMGSKIRALDEDICWCVAQILEDEARMGNIEIPHDIEIKGGGFRNFQRQLSFASTMMNLLQLKDKIPEIGQRMNVSWVLAEYTAAQGIDDEKFWISEEEYQIKKQQMMQSPQVQMQLQQAQAALAALQAKTSKDDAQAQKYLADAKKALASIEHGEGRLELDRAKGAMEVAGEMRKHKAESKRAFMSNTSYPGATVKATVPQGQPEQQPPIAA